MEVPFPRQPLQAALLLQRELTLARGRRTMATQLLLHERIETTLPKAKELRKTADKLITMGKQAREGAAGAAPTPRATPTHKAVHAGRPRGQEASSWFPV